MTLLNFVESIAPLLSSQMARSLIWMYCRTVTEPKDDDRSYEISLKTFSSEFTASQKCFSERQIFDWSPLYLKDKDLRRIDHGKPYIIRRIVHYFTARINKMQNLFPQVQRKKNVSQETAGIYQERYPDRQIVTVTTRDLEVHYGETGEQIGGGCEIRSAWKFNDLKPRFYYAQGGKDYFLSRYMKKIAVQLMESIEETRMERRKNPIDNIKGNSLEDTIITWDYSAFTSSLSELKYFIEELAYAMDQERVYDLTLVDYHLGEVKISIGDLLRSYNQVNQGSEFSIHRVVAYFISEGLDEHRHIYQQNSGMLGVAGNIGFSTALHGAVMSNVLEPDSGVCVGDDGLARDPDPEERLIPEISRLGTLHPEKFKIIKPGEQGPIRFVKRGLSRLDDGSLFLDILHNFPLSPFIDEDYGTRTVPPDLNFYRRHKKFAVQVGAFIWGMANRYDQEPLTDMDIKIALSYLKIAYNWMKFPTNGALSGQHYIKEKGQERVICRFTIAPICFKDYDPREVDWLDFLMSKQNDEVGIIVPVMGYPVSPPMFEEGQSYYVCSNEVIKAMEDLGYIDIEEQTEMILMGNEDSWHRIRRTLGRVDDDMRKVVRASCKVDVPEKFRFLFQGPLLVDGGSWSSWNLLF
jgi:hypothetical protein